jgi:hypothetical protein
MDTEIKEGSVRLNEGVGSHSDNNFIFYFYHRVFHKSEKQKILLLCLFKHQVY